jgi:hypothetical protein
VNSWQLPAMTGTPLPRRQREWGGSWHARPRHTTFALAALSISHVNRTLNPPSLRSSRRPPVRHAADPFIHNAIPMAVISGMSLVGGATDETIESPSFATAAALPTASNPSL